MILKKVTKIFGVLMTSTLVIAISIGLYSFRVAKSYTDEFLKQLGITSTIANSKINNGFLFGSFDEYGLKKVKTLAIINRSNMVKEVINYTKQYVSTKDFINEYERLRLKEKPEIYNMKSPEQMQKEMLEDARKNLAEAEAYLKTADASLKPVFEKVVAEGKKQKMEMENPNNKMLINYRKNYEAGLKSANESNKQLLANWEANYPSNHQLFIKMRLQQFLEETENIDFDAQLTEKNGKKYFVNKAYESKSNRWKMAFRAGKEPIETARKMVHEWIDEIK